MSNSNNITGKKLLDLWGVEASHALYRQDGKWYHNLKAFPGVLFDETGYLVFNTKEEYDSNPYLNRKKLLTVSIGISNIPGYVRVIENNQATELVYKAIEFTKSVPPIRKTSITERIIRDSALARTIKSVYGYRCQICLTVIEISQGKQFYAEAHHIKPLGGEHKGLDVSENMLCVCPNHHVQLDYGAIPINLSELLLDSSHRISEDYVAYHNNEIYKP
jgi:5-methylcytosine-specific restriction protein A